MVPIQNRDVYNTNMERSVVDKMFWTGIIQPDLVVDFGCANGHLISEYLRMFPACKAIGYDEDQNMIWEAQAKKLHGATFHSNWQDALDKRDDWQERWEYKGKTALLLSSVIHEVLSYKTLTGVASFWHHVWSSGFDYIIIRDMAVSKHVNEAQPEPLNVARIRQRFDPKLLAQWEDRWGVLDTNNQSFIHFLLTHQYITNWKRELEENYLGLYFEDLISSLGLEYDIVYLDHYCLPYMRHAVRTTFGFDFNEKTHVKLILEKKT